MIGECKWTARKMGPVLLQELRQKGARLKKLNGYKMHYALFSKSGFTSTVLKSAQEKSDVLLFSGARFKPVGTLNS